MTCIVGMEKDGIVYIGGDSAASNGWTVVDAMQPKVFKNGPMVMGYTTSFRFGQLLEHSLEVPTAKEHRVSDLKYLCTEFVDEVRECLKKGGYAKIDNNVEEGGSALFGYNGRLYKMDSDFQILRAPCGVFSVGSGYVAALAVLFHIVKNRPGTPPQDALREALEIATDMTPGVKGPFHFLNSA